MKDRMLPSFLCSSSTARASAATIAIAGAPGQTLAVNTCHRHTLRCTSDTHRFDAIKSLLASRDMVVDEFMGELQLIQDLELASHVLDSFEACHLADSFARTFVFNEFRRSGIFY